MVLSSWLTNEDWGRSSLQECLLGALGSIFNIARKTEKELALEMGVCESPEAFIRYFTPRGNEGFGMQALSSEPLREARAPPCCPPPLSDTPPDLVGKNSPWLEVTLQQNCWDERPSPTCVLGVSQCVVSFICQAHHCQDNNMAPP